MALPLFSATLFISAFILFLVQPIIGKLILPMLGGTPQVWNTCMVFFQTALLAGYAYTHTSTSRFPLHKQLMVHCGLLFLPLLILMPPLGPFDFRSWSGNIPLGGNPMLWALGLLTLLVGLPFFVVATSSPLLQRWFAHTGHEAAKDPYFLSIASNIGSLLALLAYPVFVEPYLTLAAQKWTWTVMYILLGGLIMVCAATVWKSPPLREEPAEPTTEPGIPAAPLPPQPETAVTATPQAPPKPPQQTGISRKKFGKGGAGAAAKPQSPAVPAGPVISQAEIDLKLRSRPITPWRRLRWVLLAAAPSSLMLGVVTYICTDLSPIPLLWIIPLALYLLSFILVFAKWPIEWTRTPKTQSQSMPSLRVSGLIFHAIETSPHMVCIFLQPVLVLGLVLMLSRGFASGPILHMMMAMGAFFATALVCHGEMAKDRPDPKHLTEFYLWMSVGGMVGGMFNGLVAPLLFWGVAEFPLAIVLGILLRPQMKANGWTENFLDSFFPSMVASFRDKGNALAKAYNKPEPNSSYVLNYSLDILLPLVLGLFAFGLMRLSHYLYWPYEHESNGLYKFYRTMKFAPDNAIWLALRTNDLLVTFIPMVICFLFYNRPIRVGLGVGALLFVQVVYMQMREDTDTSRVIYANRSYFGVLRVREQADRFGRYRSLMHGSTHHGLNYQKGKYRRLATTYYHQYGPAGMVMLKYNWFRDGFRKYPLDEPEARRTYDESKWLDDMLMYKSDARMPAALVGLSAANIGMACLPIESITAGLWAEPPFATIGLGTGTMASYTRIFQHCHYYEIDRQIRLLSLPENESQMFTDADGNKGPYFNYLQDAIDRGGIVQVRMGDARLRMAYPYSPYNLEEERLGQSKAGGPEGFYHMMVVDAFSSDAIPIHLITVEAIKMYMSKLSPDGILCVHTSNRHVDLVPVVERVVEAIRMEEGGDMPNLACKRAHDSAPGQDREGGLGFAPGQFTSEWVMVARNIKLLNDLETPPLYEQNCMIVRSRLIKRNNRKMTDEEVAEVVAKHKARGDFIYWEVPNANLNLRAWTDDYSNVLSVFRW